MITRRHFIAATAAAASAGGLARAEPSRKPKRLILVYVAGGWDISWSIDPKPGVVATPEGATVETFASIPILVHEQTPNVRAFFEANADITAVVHGIYVRSLSHQSCDRKMFTGSPAGTGPDAAAMAANGLARDYPLPYLAIGYQAYSGPLGVITGRLGGMGQLNALLDPADAYPRQPGTPSYHEGFVATVEDETRIRAFVEARAERERATRGMQASNRARIDDFVESLGKGDRLRRNAEYFGARGAALGVVDQLELGLTALEQDLSWSIGVSTPVGYDTHEANDQQGPLQDLLFGGLSQLSDELQRRGMLDDTVVAVFSEMSRTPQLNVDLGKDHHVVTSALVFGGGVAGGVAYGANDDAVMGEPVDFATGEVDRIDGQHIDAANWVAGLVALTGADPSPYLPNADPFTAFVG